MKYKIDPDLVENMIDFFQKHEGNSEVDQDKMSYLIESLPGILRI